MNSNAKGNAREREVCLDLETRFNMSFTRTIQSGASATRSTFSKKPREKFIKENTGDIFTPQNFRFTIEAKHYSSFDVFSYWSQNCLLDSWFSQAKSDAARIQKEFLVLFKFNRRKKMAMMDVLNKKLIAELKIKFVQFSQDYLILTQNDLFSLPDDFFFIKSIDKS